MGIVGGERTRTSWTPSMEQYFIDLLLDQMHRGNRFGHTFNKQAWIDMQTMLNARFGCHYDKDILKSRYTMLWKQFNEVKNLLEQNEFSWDDDKKMVLASDYVWDAYIQAHPEAQSYRNKALRNFNDLCLIYAYTAADGRYSRSSHDIDLDDDIPGVNIDVDIGMGSVAPARHEHSKADWTPAMDRYFIKLMLDQLKKGNKIDNTFNKTAWEEILTPFNVKFRSQYGKNILKRRYKKLFKYYADVSRMLEKKGFSWDEKQQRILADDGVWDNYIKAHPGARSYRKKALLSYQDLGLIYGNAIINGHLHLDKKFKDTLQIMAGEEKEGQSSVGFDRLRTEWTPPMDRYLIDLLQDQVLRGNKIDHTLVTQAWTEMVSLFNAKFGSHYGKSVLKNRYKHLRRQYNDIKNLLEQSGFFWDDSQEMVTAEDYVWDSYAKAHPDAQLYRNRYVPSYHKLCVIYGQESSNGRWSPSVCNVDFDSEGPVLMNGEDIQCHANNDLSSTDWTPSMDRYLIDLMLEEVHLRNRIDHVFNNQLWIDMVVLFKDRFGSRHEKDFLRSQHDSLGKQYNEMKSLLDQGGFSWDETRQMITANDDVWDVYLKEHPDVESYRNNTRANYNDLCLIYGNKISDLGQIQDIGFNGDGTRLDDSHFRTDWTPPMDRYLIDLMLEQVLKGSIIDNKLGKQAWGDMVAKFSAEFGSQYDKCVLKSRSNKLRKLFNDMRNLLDQNGFTWDEMRQVITANNDLWDAYAKEHPDARSYRNRTLPNYNDLFLIYGNATSSRRHNHSSNFMTVDNCGRGVKNGDEDEQSLAGSGLLRIHWTQLLDRYYIDLMLEQVQRGNKIDNTFKEQAWDWMISSFHEKFGVLCYKFELENRYLSLMKEYNNITALLNRNEFAWDESRQTVIADDDVWEAYIKEHPDAIRYRDRVVDNYKDLCRIYDNKIAQGGLSGLGIKREIDDGFVSTGISKFGGVEPPAREFKTTYQRKRRKTPSTLASSRKVQRSIKEGIDGTLEERAVGVGKIVENEAYKDYSSIELIVDALQTIPDMDDELFLEACALLEDERKAKMFVAMDVSARRKWLLRNLRR